MDKATLYGVSVGPGDPELLTLKAVRVIREADVVAVPSIGRKRQVAHSIAQEYLTGKEVVDCPIPITQGREATADAYRSIAERVCGLLEQGKSVAYLVLGDACVYSSYMYIHDLVRAQGFSTQVVPGVTSFCAAAAKLGMALCEGPERLVVAPVLAGDVDDVLDMDATRVFMKSGRALGDLRAKIEQRGMADRASMVCNCGLDDEQVFEHLADAGDVSDYFSLVIVKE